VVKRPPIVVSACLLGRRCRWDGGHKDDPAVRAAVAGRDVVPVCPEELAGLGTPRPPAELRGGDAEAVLEGRARVVTVAENEDRTAAFIAGARAALRQALASGAREAILKDGSPSCGVRTVHRDGREVSGQGLLAVLLKSNDLAVRGERGLGGGDARETPTRTSRRG
jgi:uncharacterized protein YbbK (DUF523 family)